MTDSINENTPSNDALMTFFDTPQYNLLFGNNNQLDPIQRFQESPGYQFQMDEGSRNIQRNLASKGLLSSGNAMRELTEYGHGLANQEYNNWQNMQNSLFGNYQNQLWGLTNLGSQLSGISSAYDLGNNMANNSMQIGNALSNTSSLFGQNMAGLYANEAPFYANLYMNTAAAKAQNFANNYAMNIQQQNNSQASSAGNSAAGGLFGGQQGGGMGGGGGYRF